MEAEGRGGCQICEAAARPLLCPACLARGPLAPRVQALQDLRAARAALADRLLALLPAQEKRALQRLDLQVAGDRADRAQSRVARAQKRTQSARRELHWLRSSVAERAAHLEEGLEQVKNQREELPGQASPEVEQRTGLQLAALTRQVSLERRSRLKCLLAILPLSLQSSPRKQPLAKPAVSICGLLLPGLSVPMLEDAHHAQEMSTGLGYMSLFLNLAARYLDGPVLHLLSFQNSTSSLWTPGSFWEDGLGPGAKRMDLHIRTAALATAAPPAPAMPGSSAMYTLASLQQHWENIKTAAGSAAPANMPTRQQRIELSSAIRVLAQDAAALVAHAMGPNLWRLPAEWTPFACLAAVATYLSDAGRSSPSSQSTLEDSIHMQTELLPLHPPGLLRPRAAELAGAGHGDREGGDWDILSRPGDSESFLQHHRASSHRSGSQPGSVHSPDKGNGSSQWVMLSWNGSRLIQQSTD